MLLVKEPTTTIDLDQFQKKNDHLTEMQWHLGQANHHFKIGHDHLKHYRMHEDELNLMKWREDQEERYEPEVI